MYPQGNIIFRDIAPSNSFGGQLTTCIYDKTEKGREEIATRKYGLPHRLRTMLVLIDGRTALELLLHNFAGLGLNQGIVDQLLNGQYIVLISEAPQPRLTPHQPAVQQAPASARARILARRVQALRAAQQGAPWPVLPAPLDRGAS